MATRARKKGHGENPGVLVTTELVRIWFDWPNENEGPLSGAHLRGLFSRTVDWLEQRLTEAPMPQGDPYVLKFREHEFQVFKAQLRSAIARKNPNVVIGPAPRSKRGIKKDSAKTLAAALEISRLLPADSVRARRELSRMPDVIWWVARKYSMSPRTAKRHYDHLVKSPDHHLKVRTYLTTLKETGALEYTPEEIASTLALAAKHGIPVPERTLALAAKHQLPLPEGLKSAASSLPLPGGPKIRTH